MKVRPEDNHQLAGALWFCERTPKLQVGPP